MSIKKKVSLKEIAESIPCSPATVSVVLSGRGDQYRIAPETQATIRETAKKMGYMTKASKVVKASADSSNSFIKIGVFMGLNDALPLNDILKGMSEYVMYGGKRIEYCLHPYDQGYLRDLESVLLNNRYDGIILIPTGRRESDYLRGLKVEHPFVVMAQSVPGYNCVIADRMECGALIAKLFMAKGFRNIGLVTRNTLSESGMLRTFGFTSTYEKNSSPNAKITVIEDKTDGDFGLASMNELLDKTAANPPEAVFVTEPNNISGTVSSLRKYGKTPPNDLELVVFGNYSDNAINQCLSPSITTIGIPVKKMMIDCIDLVCHQVEGGILHGVTKVHHPELSFRESCPKPEYWDSIV